MSFLIEIEIKASAIDVRHTRWTWMITSSTSLSIDSFPLNMHNLVAFKNRNANEKVWLNWFSFISTLVTSQRNDRDFSDFIFVGNVTVQTEFYYCCFCFSPISLFSLFFVTVCWSILMSIPILFFFCLQWRLNLFS